MTVTAPLLVHVVPMRRRHLRSVLRIEGLVYPPPVEPLALPLRARAPRVTAPTSWLASGANVTGYAGLMLSGEDGHVTTIAVDPAWHRRHIGMRLLLVLAREAIARGAKNLTLEVRLSNRGAQELYRRFGSAPVGVRKNYYQETHEDTLRDVGPRRRHPGLRRPARRARAHDPRRGPGYDDRRR